MASFDVSGKHAIITGGGSGIGLAFVQLLLARGCSVLIGDLGLNPTSEKLLEEYKPQTASGEQGQQRPFLAFHKTDVKSFDELDALWKKALDTFPHVDLVMPGAGVYEPPWSSFWHAPGAEGSPSTDSVHQEMGNYATFSINLIHPIRLSQLAIGYWTTTKTRGCLLYIGSMGAYVQTLGTPYYYSSKAGLHAFIKSLAGLRKRLGIRVVAIAPGATRTPLWDQDHAKVKLGTDDPVLTPEPVAELMLDLVQKEEYGDGNIVEIMNLGTNDEPKINVRELPYGLMAPPVSGFGVPTLILEEETLWNRLEEKGLQTQ